MKLDRKQLVLFESQLRRNFEPLSLTRQTFDFLLGTKSIRERIESDLGCNFSNLVVPEHLEALCKEKNPDCSVNSESSSCIAINSLVRPSFGLAREIELALAENNGEFAVVDSSGNVIFAALDYFNPRQKIPLFQKVKRKILLKQDRPSLLVYPWELVSENFEALNLDYDSFKAGKSISNKSDCEILGTRVSISSEAEIGRFTTLDSRGGPIMIDGGAIIQSFSHLTGPCYVGNSSIIKSAKIREGTSIGKECRVGGEVEETIIHDYSNKAHDGFLGHSVIGSWVNLGALTTNSDLKSTYGTIKVNLKGKSVDTKTIKVGCFVSDMCKTSIGCMIFSGKTIGVSSSVLGVVSKDVTSFTLHSSESSTPDRELFLDSSIETQRRMMERRKIEMSSAYKEMMKSVFKMTSKSRLTSGIRKGRFKL